MQSYQSVHCIGIGGIHVSAVAKLLKARGVFVSGSDTVDHGITQELREKGFEISIGHKAENIPEGTEVVVYSHAVPEDNPEIVEAKKRGIELIDTHAFLAKLFEGKDQIVVTGTHGKSTTSSMLGSVLVDAGTNPTVVVGTKVATFPDGNLRIGSEDLLVVEGDEYRQHVLEYDPKILVINNIEFDHPDAFQNEEAYFAMFRELIELVRDNGIVIVNADDDRLLGILKEKIDSLKERNVSLISVGKEQGVVRFSDPVIHDGIWTSRLTAAGSEYLELDLKMPGEMNIRNGMMAVTAAVAFNDEIDLGIVAKSLADFPGCWRRYEHIGEINGISVISDYGHHPTEVAATLQAAKASNPDKRVVLCFQPHHRNRTKGLFEEFVSCFDHADVLLLSEIYDVPGREAKEDADMSSAKLVEAVQKRDAERGIDRIVEFVGDLEETKKAIINTLKDGDVLLMMGAGTIDKTAREMVSEAKAS